MLLIASRAIYTDQDGGLIAENDETIILVAVGDSA